MVAKIKAVEYNRESYYEEGISKFERMINKAIEEITYGDGLIVDIKYCTHHRGNYTHYSAIIIYNEVAKRKVLTEKSH